MWVASAFIIAGCCTFGIMVIALSTRAGRNEPPTPNTAASSSPMLAARSQEPLPLRPPPSTSTNQPAESLPTDRPSAAWEGQRWEADQVCDYLRRRGVAFQQRERPRATVPGIWLVRGRETVLMCRHASTFDAIDASVMDRSSDRRLTTFTFGRFSCAGQDGPLLRAVRKVLRGE
jgi:hypothetical protein